MVERLTELLAACAAAAEAAVAGRLDDAGYGDVTRAQTALLVAVGTAGAGAGGGGASAAAVTLAGPLGVSPQAVSKTAGDLVGRGYLVSEADPTDRRARRLALTPRAAAYLTARDEAVAAVVREQRRWLGERDATELLRILTALGELDGRGAGNRRASGGRRG
jgi:DNA-binding MarR family transcriptional regulator